jgi:hypothetical protein
VLRTLQALGRSASLESPLQRRIGCRTAAFVQRGATMLTDDVAAIEWPEEWFCRDETDGRGNISQVVRPMNEALVFDAYAHPHVVWPRQLS